MTQIFWALVLVALLIWLACRETIEGYYYPPYNPRRGYYRQSFSWPIWRRFSETNRFTGPNQAMGPYRYNYLRFPYWRGIYRNPRWLYSANRLPFYRTQYDVRY